MRSLNCHAGLYRDDGLVATSGTPNQIEKQKQAIQKIYNEEGLKITTEANKKIVNFLDVTLNLHNRTFTPYLKDGNIPLYIHVESNHPP